MTTIKILATSRNAEEGKLLELILEKAWHHQYHYTFTEDISEVLLCLQSDSVDLLILEILWFLGHENEMKKLDIQLKRMGVIMLWGRIDFFEGEPGVNLDFVDKIMHTPFIVREFINAVEDILGKYKKVAATE